MPEATDDDRGASSSETEPARIDRYVVLGRLGEGAMGVVYRAYDESLDRKVALKLLRPQRGEARAGRLRLQREAQALAQLSHPNVVQVYDVGVWNGQDYITLEFVRGRTVRTWLSERPREWTEIVETFVQAGRGLAAAHAAGLVHRDFKPKTRSLRSPPPSRRPAGFSQIGAICGGSRVAWHRVASPTWQRAGNNAQGDHARNVLVVLVLINVRAAAPSQASVVRTPG